MGYWPRVAFDLGLLAFGLALIRCAASDSHYGDSGVRWPDLGLAATWVLLVGVGVGLTVYHRPLSRLRAVVPGRIYISAMPTYRGLAIEQERLHFKTIINLFDESSEQASPGHADEIRFVREHGLRYLGSPSDGMESDRFLDETLAIARDPEAWPILVHCHGCMDRSPAWMGIYRFVVEGVPLEDVFREIERHRGSRPKAVVTLQYNRKLPPRAPERFAADPTRKALLRRVRGRGPKDPVPPAQLERDGDRPAGRHPDRARPVDPPAVTCGPLVASSPLMRREGRLLGLRPILEDQHPGREPGRRLAAGDVPDEPETTLRLEVGRRP